MDNSPHNDSAGPSISIDLLHKPRDAGGRWMPVPNNARLRVARMGKPMRLMVHIEALAGAVVNWQSLKVHLRCKNSSPAGHSWHPLTKNNAMSILSIMVPEDLPASQSKDFSRLVSVKLFHISDTLCFTVEVSVNHAGQTILLQANTVAFYATNSGGTVKKRNNISCIPQVPIDIDEDEEEEQPPASVEQEVHPPPYIPAMTYSVQNHLNVEGIVVVHTYSDVRLKEHIQDLSDAASTLARMRGVTFRWRKGAEPHDLESVGFEGNIMSVPKAVGVIAQEMAAACPEVVHETSDGFLTVAYTELVPVIIEALKSRERELASLASRSAELVECQKTLAEQLRALSASLAQVSASSFTVVAMGDAPRHLSSPSQPPARLRTTSKSKTPAPPQSLPAKVFDFIRRHKIQLIAAIGLLFCATLVLAIVLPLNASSQATVPPPITGNTTTFRTSNYFVDPDFEDLSQFPRSPGWDGDYTLAAYASSSVLTELQKTASFNTGQHFLLLETSTTSSFATASTFLLPTGPTPANPIVNASLWVATLSSITPGSTAVVDVRVYPLSPSTDSCNASHPIDPSVSSWQLINFVFGCSFSEQIHRIEFRLVISGFPTEFAFDHAYLSVFPREGSLPPAASNILAQSLINTDPKPIDFFEYDPAVIKARAASPVSIQTDSSKLVVTTMAQSFTLDLARLPSTRTDVPVIFSFRIFANNINNIDDDDNPFVLGSMTASISVLNAGPPESVEVIGQASKPVVIRETATYFDFSINCTRINLGSVDDFSSSAQFIRMSLDLSLEATPTANVDYTIDDIEIYQDPPNLLARLSSAIVGAPKRTVSPHRRIISECPHLQAGLLKWESPATWPDGILPTSGSDAVILPPNKAILVSNSTNLSSFDEIVIPSGSKLIFADENQRIRVEHFTILPGGALIAGSDDCPISSVITFEFHPSYPEITDLRNHQSLSGINVSAGGLLQLVGRPYLSWTRLALSAYVGDNVIFVQDAVDWKPGQRIVIMSSTQSDLQHKYDALEIDKVSLDGKFISTKEAIQYYHFAGPEYQAQVGLLSRNIIINGPDDSVLTDRQLYGGTLSIHGIAIISGVQFFRMAQNNILFKYPVNLLQASSLSRIQRCSFEMSFYGCVMLYNTSGASIVDNVAHNIRGHCINLWSGRETNNTIEFNLISNILPIGRLFNESVGTQIITSGSSGVDPTDITASGIFAASYDNKFRHNVVRGAWAGYFFPQLTAYRDAPNTLIPVAPTRPLPLEFDGNTASGCTYGFFFGAHVSTDIDTDEYVLNLGLSEERGLVHLRRTTVVLCEMGFSIYGSVVELDTFQVIDSLSAGSFAGQVWLHDGRVVARSSRELAVAPRLLRGITVTDQKAFILSNITFAGFEPSVFEPVIDVASARAQLAFSNIFLEGQNTALALNPSVVTDLSIVTDCDCSVSDTFEGSCFASVPHPYWRTSNIWTDVPEWPGSIHPNSNLFGIARMTISSVDVVGSPVLPNAEVARLTWRRPSETTPSEHISVNARDGLLAGYDSSLWRVQFVAAAPRAWNVSIVKLEQSKSVILSIPYSSVSGANIRMHGPSGQSWTVPASPSVASLMSSTTMAWVFDSSVGDLLVRVAYPSGFTPAAAFTRGGCSVSAVDPNPLTIRAQVSA